MSEKRKKAIPEVVDRSEFEKRMAEIAAAIKRGEPAEKFDAEMDRMLGTGAPARDREAEAVYEDRRRVEAEGQ